ncbi:MAG: hypothetical protein U0103_18835 [Candidatus Obscuribacterales bacterium]|nr:MAG: hypothetical protein EKK48_20345 [Candidatus Melainabacteria bacterium]
MSDRPSSYPGNGGNEDMYRWSGDQRQLPSNQNGDRYIYDGSGRQNGQNGDDQYDAFHGDRMPGRMRPSDYPQNFTTREVTADGTVIINNVHCKNAYFNQTPIDGADYRRDSRMDFRHCDPNLSRLRENNGTSFYDNDRSQYNGSYRIPDRAPRYDDMQARIDAARQREYDQQAIMQQRIEMAREQQYRQQFEQQQRIDQMRQYQMQRDCDEAVRIQMYNENCRRYNGRHEPPRPYYGDNGGCFGNGSYPVYNDGYGGGYGGPCFGNRSGISIRIPIGHNASGSFRIGF